MGRWQEVTTVRQASTAERIEQLERARESFLIKRRGLERKLEELEARRKGKDGEN